MSKFHSLGLLLAGLSCAHMAYCAAGEPVNLVGPFEAKHAFKALSQRAQVAEEVQEAVAGKGFRLNPPMSPVAEAKPYCQSDVSATEGQVDDFVARFQDSPILAAGLSDPSLKKMIQSEMAAQRGKRIVLPIVHASMASLPVLTYPPLAQHPTSDQHVDLAVAISKDGHVSALLVVCAEKKELIDPAIQAAQLFKFKPAMLDGQPVAEVVMVPVKFEP